MKNNTEIPKNQNYVTQDQQIIKRENTSWQACLRNCKLITKYYKLFIIFCILLHKVFLQKSMPLQSKFEYDMSKAFY